MDYNEEELLRRILSTLNQVNDNLQETGGQIRFMNNNTLNDLNDVLNNNKMVGAMKDLYSSMNTIFPSAVDTMLDVNGKYIRRMQDIQDRHTLEQALANATQQFISIKIALRNGTLEKEEAIELLTLSNNSLGRCYERLNLSDKDKEDYKVQYGSLLKKHRMLILELQNQNEQD